MSHDEGQKTQAEGLDVAKVMDRLKSLEATNERLLMESKEHKSKYQEYKSKFEERESKELEDKGEYEALLKKSRDEQAKLAASLKEKEKMILFGNIKSSLANAAKDAHDIEDIMRSPEASSIQYDEDTGNVDLDSVQMVISGLREKKPYLFASKKIASQASGAPAGDSANLKPKSLGKMSTEEIEEQLRKMK